MIASISGMIRRKSLEAVIIDVGGVGFQVQVPLSTLASLPEAGEAVSLHIHTHLREDSLSLFGFLGEPEKEAFLLLLSVSGIGPKLALSVLSSLSVADLLSALRSSDEAKLCAIPGIGRKTAARMILELKDKASHAAAEQGPPETRGAGAGSDVFEDAVSGLVNLGYKRQPAEDAARTVLRGRTGARVEDLIREALSVLMKR